MKRIFLYFFAGVFVLLHHNVVSAQSIQQASQAFTPKITTTRSVTSQSTSSGGISPGGVAQQRALLPKIPPQPNRAPVFDFEANVEKSDFNTLLLTVAASDPDNHSITITGSGAGISSSYALLNSAGRNVSIFAIDAGGSLTFTANDGQGGVAVLNMNVDSSFSATERPMRAGELNMIHKVKVNRVSSIPFSFHDEDGDSMNVYVVGQIAGYTIEENIPGLTSGHIDVVGNSALVGTTQEILIYVQNTTSGRDGLVKLLYETTSGAANTSPRILQVQSHNLDYYGSKSVTVTAFDPDGDDIDLFAAGATVYNGSAQSSGTGLTSLMFVLNSGSDINDINISAQDEHGATAAAEEFQETDMMGSKKAPLINGLVNEDVQVGHPWFKTLVMTDQNGDSMNFHAVLPANAGYNIQINNPGLMIVDVWFVPDASQLGDNEFYFYIDDNTGMNAIGTMNARVIL